LIKVFLAFVLLVVLYVGSSGPVLKMYGHRRPPLAVEVFYTPVMICYHYSPIAKRFLDWYFHMWKIK
jgi:hypothetical protein